MESVTEPAAIQLDAEVWRAVEAEARRMGAHVSDVVHAALVVFLTTVALSSDQPGSGSHPRADVVGGTVERRGESEALVAESRQAIRQARRIHQRTAAIRGATRTGRTFRATPDFGQICPLDGRQAVEQCLESWLEAHVHPDDRARVRVAILDSVQRANVIELEHRGIRSDGSTAPIHTRAAPLIGQDGIVSAWLLATSEVGSERPQP